MKWRSLLEKHKDINSIFQSGQRVDIFRVGSSTPIGSIKEGSSWSGSIWKRGECVAEYEILPRGRFSVKPIVEGRILPETVNIDPFSYLLSISKPQAFKIRAKKAKLTHPTRVKVSSAR
jgi:hypothetical protein